MRQAQLLEGLGEADAALLELQLALVEPQLVQLLLAREPGGLRRRGGTAGAQQQARRQERTGDSHST